MKKKRVRGCLVHFQKFVSACYPEVTVFHNNEVLLTHCLKQPPLSVLISLIINLDFGEGTTETA